MDWAYLAMAGRFGHNAPSLCSLGRRRVMVDPSVPPQRQTVNSARPGREQR